MINNLFHYTKPMNILYVEDHDDTKEITMDILKVFFNNIIVSDNGSDAFKIFMDNKDNIDLVFTDILIPNINGIELSKKIRQFNKDIPIVVLSAHDDKQYLMECIKFNVADFLVKPYTLEDLLQVIKKIISNKYDDFILLSEDIYWCRLNNTLFKDNQAIHLTKNERCFIKLLIDYKRKLYSNESSMVTRKGCFE